MICPQFHGGVCELLARVAPYLTGGKKKQVNDFFDAA